MKVFEQIGLDPETGVPPSPGLTSATGIAILLCLSYNVSATIFSLLDPALEVPVRNAISRGDKRTCFEFYQPGSLGPAFMIPPCGACD